MGMIAACNRFAASFLPVAVSFFLCTPLASAQLKGQSQQGMPQGLPQSNSSLSVNVRLPDGSTLDRGVVINLYSFTGGFTGMGSNRGGHTEFSNIPVGRYTLEVVAAGYQKLTQSVDISIAGEHEQVDVTLTPESSAGTPSSPADAPILAPNAQKELSKGLEAIRENKLDEAKKHLDKLSKAAPANPDVNYLWGMYYLERKDLLQARSCWEKAIQIYPRHAFSLAALSQLALQRGDSPTAISYLGRAVEAAPSSWRFEERFAGAYLQHQEYEQAQKHAEHAIELGKERATEAPLILAKARAQLNLTQDAPKVSDAGPAQPPPGPLVVEPLQMPGPLVAPATPAAALTIPALVVAQPSAPAASTIASIAADLVPPPKWMPPDVDESMSAVETGVACPLEKIQDETGKRVHEFIDAVNRISATESLYDEVIDRFGFPERHESRNYSYVASVAEIRPGMYDVEEYRNGTMALDIFPEHIATLGLTSLVMIFHPVYRDDYQVTCEGLSHWHGGLAWQVHFRQRPDKPARLREYRVGGQSFPISLRGRAWIAVDTFQVVSIETDVVAPIPQIRLKAEHTAIEYMPVKFASHNQELWLPESAELFFDFGGRRMHRRHHFRDYMLFAVDEKQKISAPKMEAEASPDSDHTSPQ
jgi:tetratricopeptide (TPR) repeat protein